MSGLQVGVLILIVAAYALGWWSARYREVPEPEPEPEAPAGDGRRHALLAADAALVMWRVERGRLSPAARHAMVIAAGQLRGAVAEDAEPGSVETSALRALAKALEDAALAGHASPEPTAVARAARDLLDRRQGA